MKWICTLLYVRPGMVWHKPMGSLPLDAVKAKEVSKGGNDLSTACFLSIPVLVRTADHCAFARPLVSLCLNKADKLLITARLLADILLHVASLFLTQPPRPLILRILLVFFPDVGRYMCCKAVAAIEPGVGADACSAARSADSAYTPRAAVIASPGYWQLDNSTLALVNVKIPHGHELEL